MSQFERERIKKAQEQVKALSQIRALINDNFYVQDEDKGTMFDMLSDLRSWIELEPCQRIEYSHTTMQYEIIDPPACKNCGETNEDKLAVIPMINGKKFYICTDCMTTIKKSKTLYQVSGGGSNHG